MDDGLRVYDAMNPIIYDAEDHAPGDVDHCYYEDDYLK
jgi:hypothetical protein